jgi:methylthioribose-1-phosphate isomerase
MARRDGSGYDPRRREFFRVFGRQTVRNAGAMMGAASEIRRAGGDAARELFDLGSPMPMDAPTAVSAAFETPGAPPAVPFRSAYLLGEDGLLLLDQRDLPGRTSVLTVREPSEIASAIRLGAVNAGPVLGEICAYGLALAAADAAGRSTGTIDLAFRGAVSTLRAARPEVRAVAYGVGRVARRYDELTADGPLDDTAELAAAVRAEADNIATDNALGHAALGREAAEYLNRRAAPREADAAHEPINLLMHGDMGPLSSGLVGPGTAIIQSLTALGARVHVWLTDAAPGMEGRIAALQLMQADVPHTVISDSAVGWLLSSRRLDAALIRGDYVCANGDTSSVIGSLNVAALAGAAGVQVLVIAPKSAVDLDLPDGGKLMVELRSPAENARTSPSAEVPQAALFGVRLNPGSDVVPAALISGFLTESGFSTRLAG